ncbi:MAG TPA: hypothetical protein VNN73_14855 [Blastocatellia bacterium]|nr:hypothetical protein [Blastocatellia bacterium]
MQSKRFSAASRLIVLLLCALFVASVSNVAQAQSGRRIPKRPASPDPLPPKTDEPPIEPAKPKDDKPLIPVLVVRYQSDISVSSIYPNIVAEGCFERLKDSASVKPTLGRELNRKQASDEAKTANTNVVWIELQADMIDRQRYGGFIDPSYLYVNYVVFEAGTGKTKTSGHVYQRNRAVGGVPVPGRMPGTTAAAEYNLKYAGRETADRVLDALDLPHPPERRY